MAFHEVRLPSDVERGAVGGPRFKTTVLQLASGFEQRNIDWEQVKGEWDISYGLMSLRDNELDTYIHAVRDFFYARSGRAHGFRFKDWSDFEIGEPSDPLGGHQLIGLGDGATTQFQVFKRYSSGGVSYDRVIKKLVSGTVSVLLDSVVQLAGYSVDVNTGLVTFDVAPAATGGSGPGGEVVVQVACEFDVPVRFDDDHLKITVQTAQAGQIPAIPLVEIRV
ncbi:MAG TPA: DUF2460 domain-containing protein [Trueperaceae bacterium]|nr:DUF2460 domain-containing protein [Trueperaceae bacterium]